MSTSTTSATEERALSLLGQGLGPEIVASAVGVSVSRISQLLSDPKFSAQVATLRYESLAKHNDRDNRYDQMEDQLLDKMKDLIQYMVKPFEVLKAIQVINQAKRRGSSAPESITNQQTVVQLVMPTQIIQNFSKDSITVNVNNQVVRAGNQDLVTTQSSSMDRLLSQSKIPKLSAGVQDVEITNRSGT
jgi:uncharacterized protein YeaC (DUF1315 family)